MAEGKLVVDVSFQVGEPVNWLGCNGYIVAVVVGDRCVSYEVQLMDNQGALTVGRFGANERSEEHAV